MSPKYQSKMESPKLHLVLDFDTEILQPQSMCPSFCTVTEELSIEKVLWLVVYID